MAHMRGKPQNLCRVSPSHWILWAEPENLPQRACRHYKAWKISGAKIIILCPERSLSGRYAGRCFAPPEGIVYARAAYEIMLLPDWRNRRNWIIWKMPARAI
jgi:hypothetical protein